MPYYKKCSLFFVFILTCLLASAAPRHILIKNADLKLSGEAYMLNADLEIALGEKVEEAINKGVPVEFVYEFELVRPRLLWLDADVMKTSTRIKVGYHALSRQYLVSQDGRQTSHDILSEAMIELVQLYDWKVFNKSIIDPNRTYQAVLSMKLDQSKLPKAIQVDAIGSEGWDLASEQFEWVPKDLNR
ncbi:MAG: DUF4390 domain-containing protein [Methylophilaceae bacterium]|nr:MAG: DUF4390 domain-containing protein [Methylophilaceae bacterium]